MPTQEAVQKLIAARLARRRDGRADGAARAHRRGSGRHRHHRRGRERQAVPHRRAHLGRLLQDEKGFDQALSRGLAYAEYADMVWCETGTPDLAFARKFAEGIRKKYPGKMLAYNCSPSFNWKRNLDDATIAKFQRELGAMGYKFQFITLAGFHSLNYSMFELALRLRAQQHDAPSSSCSRRSSPRPRRASPRSSTSARSAPATSTRSRRSCTAGKASTTALHGSTEDEQFFGEDALSHDRRQAKKAA